MYHGDLVELTSARIFSTGLKLLDKVNAFVASHANCSSSKPICYSDGLPYRMSVEGRTDLICPF